MKLALVLLSSAFLLSTGVASSWGQSSDLDKQLRRQSLSKRNSLRMAPVGVHPKGDYGGVQPGVSTPKSWSKRRPLKNRARRKNVVRWIGFQPKSSGNSRVFVQLTGDVEFSQALEGKDLVITLQRARLGGSNARRPLDTRFFDTTLRRVVSKRVRGAIQLRISFKNPADAAKATADMQKNDGDGYTYLFLDFGPPSGSTEAGDDDDDDAGDDEVIVEEE